MSPREAKRLAANVERMTGRLLAQFESLERKLQSIPLEGRRALLLEQIKEILLSVEEQKQRQSFYYAEGKTFWVEAIPHGGSFYFVLSKKRSNRTRAWEKARSFAARSHSWVQVPYTVFCKALQALMHEITLGQLDASLENSVQRIVYSRLRAIFQNEIAKVHPEASAQRST